MDTNTVFVLLRGAMVGVVAAAAIDFQAFRSWKTYQDLLVYDWRIALFRWGQGAVLGALAALGIGAAL